MTQIIHIQCEWCLKEETFEDDDPVDSGWFRVETVNDEGPVEMDFCSGDCLISHL